MESSVSNFLPPHRLAADQLTAYTVSDAVNNPRHNTPDLIRQVESR